MMQYSIYIFRNHFILFMCRGVGRCRNSLHLYCFNCFFCSFSFYIDKCSRKFGTFSTFLGDNLLNPFYGSEGFFFRSLSLYLSYRSVFHINYQSRRHQRHDTTPQSATTISFSVKTTIVSTHMRLEAVTKKKKTATEAAVAAATAGKK